jgi:hypothetical protein
MPVPNDLVVKISGKLAVELSYQLGYAIHGGSLDRDRALLSEVAVVNAINEALANAGLPTIPEGGEIEAVLATRGVRP